MVYTDHALAVGVAYPKYTADFTAAVNLELTDPGMPAADANLVAFEGAKYVYKEYMTKMQSTRISALTIL